MERKWTQGPWRTGRSYFYAGEDERPTMRVYTDHPVEEMEAYGGRCVANAHLIAAAPDLYEALEDLAADMIEHMDDLTIAVVHNALAKARGEA